MSLLRSLFTEHPASVDETYFEHLIAASSFGIKMIAAGVACIVHGLLPAVFVTRGSETICALHERMVVKRRKIAEARSFRECSSGPPGSWTEQP
jgi:Family of unknown function (DUF6356)